MGNIALFVVGDVPPFVSERLRDMRKNKKNLHHVHIWEREEIRRIVQSEREQEAEHVMAVLLDENGKPLCLVKARIFKKN